MTTVSSRHQRILADTGLFYAAAIWGATFFIVKDALSGIDPVVMVSYRFLLAGLIMLAIVLATGRSPLKNFKQGAVLAGILTPLYLSQTIGLKYTTASNSGFITGLFVIFVPIFMRLLFHRKPSVMEWLATVVALSGLWFLTGGLTEINPGDLLTLAAAVTYALHVLYADKFLKANVDPLVISCQQFLLVGLLSLVLGVVMKLDFGVHTASAGWATVFLAIFPSMTAFAIQMWAQKITTPVKVSLIFAFEPVFAGLFAWTLGGEVFELHRGVGGLLVFAALILSGLPLPRRQH
jgi:drug/metabolite transporter (DMT)-like permease